MKNRRTFRFMVWSARSFVRDLDRLDNCYHGYVEKKVNLEILSFPKSKDLSGMKINS